MTDQKEIMAQDCEHYSSCIEKGRCSVHGIEIERRKQTGKDLEELKTYVHALEIVLKEAIKAISDKLDSEGSIGAALTRASNFRFGATVAASIMSMVFVASFIYTTNHIQKSDRRFELRKTEVEKDFELQKIEMLKRFELMSSEMHQEFDKFHRLINNDGERIKTLEIEYRLTADRYSRIISDIGRVESMLVELMKTRAEKNGITHGEY